MAGAGILMLAAFLGSIVAGLEGVDLPAVYRAFLHYEGTAHDLLVRAVRLPRALTGAAVGAALGVSGAVLQALTRNPLASPGLMGINAGAALAVVLAAAGFDIASLSVLSWFALAGAGLAATAVYLLSALSRGGPTPVKLTVAGAAITALLFSISQGILIVRERSLDEIRFWLMGSVAGRDFSMF